MFYIDIRTPGTAYERFYNTIKDNDNVKLIKGKVAKVSADSNRDVVVEAEDILAGPERHLCRWLRQGPC
jgi:heterodisulfide reductase subunit A-like polyferredoxin